jgi:AraC-like DNA-binding protein
MRRRGSGRLKRAAELFAIDEWSLDSGFVERAWTSQSEPEPFFISVAASHWQIVVATQRDLAQLTVRGPETRATVTAIPADAEFFGIVFSLGTFVPAIPLAGLVDRVVTLPAATPHSVWLDGSCWEIPTPDNADVFVDRLVRQGLVARDPVVAESLDADVDGVSTRTLQRRVARATGLTRRTIRQIARAEEAVDALQRGVSAPDATLCSATPTRPTSSGHCSDSSGRHPPWWSRRPARARCRFPSIQPIRSVRSLPPCERS